MGSKHLTTGQAARLCGVTPDAVLKWIKKGKLQATRTPGGHFRVLETDLQTRLSPSPRSSADVTVPSPGHCWEYHGSNGTPRNECIHCVVYRARVERCYELAALGEAAGHRRQFCGNNCEQCAFYRACRSTAVPVLLVTPDDMLVRRIREEADPRRLNLRSARSGYESSIVIEAFRPALVVLDGTLPEVRDGGLVKSVLNDERLPNVKVLIAQRGGAGARLKRLEVPILRSPLTAAEIERFAKAEPPSNAATRSGA